MILCYFLYFLDGTIRETFWVLSLVFFVIFRGEQFKNHPVCIKTSRGSSCNNTNNVYYSTHSSINYDGDGDDVDDDVNLDGWW